MSSDMTATFHAIRTILESIRHDPALTRSANRTLIRALASLTVKALHAQSSQPNPEILELLTKVLTTTVIKTVPYDAHYLLSKALDLAQQPPPLTGDASTTVTI